MRVVLRVAEQAGTFSASQHGVVMTFTDGLRALVEGHVQARLAEEVGVHRSAVSQWLAGASRPTPGNLEALMRAVGAPEMQRAAMRTLYFTDASDSSVLALHMADSACPQHGATSDYRDDAPTEEAPLECQPAMRAAGWVPPEERGA